METVARFGKSKGKLITTLTDVQLALHIKVCAEALADDKRSKWHLENIDYAEALLTVLGDRVRQKADETADAGI
jgi:hypothetical protein